MAQQHLNVGTTANDGTGDAVRTAAQKIESNFNELYGVTAGLGSAATRNAGSSSGNLPILDGSGLLDPSLLPSLYTESVITSGSPVSLVSATAKDIATLSLAAGDWNIWFLPGFTGGATTQVSYLAASINLLTAGANTLDETNGRFIAQPFFSNAIFNQVPSGLLGYPAIFCRASLGSTTTVHAVAQAGFTVSTCSGFGLFAARRVKI